MKYANPSPRASISPMELIALNDVNASAPKPIMLVAKEINTAFFVSVELFE